MAVVKGDGTRLGKRTRRNVESKRRTPSQTSEPDASGLAGRPLGSGKFGDCGRANARCLPIAPEEPLGDRSGRGPGGHPREYQSRSASSANRLPRPFPSWPPRRRRHNVHIAKEPWRSLPMNVGEKIITPKTRSRTVQAVAVILIHRRPNQAERHGCPCRRRNGDPVGVMRPSGSPIGSSANSRSSRLPTASARPCWRRVSGSRGSPWPSALAVGRESAPRRCDSAHDRMPSLST